MRIIKKNPKKRLKRPNLDDFKRKALADKNTREAYLEASEEFVVASRYFEEITGGPLTLSKLIYAIRMGEEKSQATFAKELKISRSHLCDIEKGRKHLSPIRAEEFAKLLGYSESQFIRLSLEEEISSLKGKYKISIEKKSA